MYNTFSCSEHCFKCIPFQTIRLISERLLLLHILFAEFEQVLESEDLSCNHSLELILMPELIR